MPDHISPSPLSSHDLFAELLRLWFVFFLWRINCFTKFLKFLAKRLVIIFMNPVVKFWVLFCHLFYSLPVLVLILRFVLNTNKIFAIWVISQPDICKKFTLRKGQGQLELFLCCRVLCLNLFFLSCDALATMRFFQIKVPLLPLGQRKTASYKYGLSLWFLFQPRFFSFLE